MHRPNRRRIRTAVLGLVACVGLLAGAPALAQTRGGTLIAAWAQDPVGLDPQITSAYSSYQVLENILDTLVTLDADQNVQPSLATSWEVSDDGLVWTFHLRDGVSFSNGRALTADDVVYTYTRMLDPATGSGNAYKIAGLTKVTAVDDATVQLTLDAPNAAFLGHLALDKSVGIIARENVEDGTIDTQPIGTGPFMISDYQPGTKVVLERNPHYWQDGLPYLDGIEIRIIPDDSVRRSALVAGDIDWAIAMPAQSIDALKTTDGLVVDETPAGAYWYIGVNTEHPPLDQVAVRQAISYAINRDDIAAAAAFGSAVPTQEPIPASSAWADDYAPYSHDPEKAKELLAEAGVPDGFEMDIMPTTQYEESVRVAQVMQAELAEVGITANINTLEWAQWLEEEGAGNYDTYVCSWNALVDPDDFFYAQHKTGEVFNFTGYSNPTVDELLDQGRRAQGFDERKPIYDQINQIIVDEAPYIYLYNPLNVNVYHDYVQGYSARADQAVRFVGTWLDK